MIISLIVVACAFLVCLMSLSGAVASDTVQGINASTLGVIVNLNDPVSRQVARYYQVQRNIPDENMLYLEFDPEPSIMPLETFRRLEGRLAKLSGSHLQGYVLTWAKPYRVDCMSITTAFTAGFDSAFCAKGCKRTRLSPYFDHASHSPYADIGWRPTMMLAGSSVKDVFSLINRGVRSDNSMPRGTAYLVSTNDQARNVRASGYGNIEKSLWKKVWIKQHKGNALTNRQDVLFYFTGLSTVRGLNTLEFIPGAIADHLTSYGGMLTDSGQMSSLRWLEAGATGSFGTVVEPCAFKQKFPDPEIVIRRYTAGETLLEAYWKSVKWPGQGVFVGEPLARPYGREMASPQLH